MGFGVSFKRPAVLRARFRSLFTFNFVTVGDIMKKIFLYAYDKINFGDDLFIRTIANRYPNVKFYLWSKKYNKKTFWNIKNLKVVAQDSKKLDLLVQIHPSLFSRYKSHLERKCDAVVYIGGSIFIEYENWKQILTWWEWEATNRTFYVLGANFGPYKTEDYRNKLSSIFENMQDVCFRDMYSFNLFKDNKKVRYAPDILFNCKMPICSKKRQIFISVIDCEKRNSGFDIICQKQDLYLELLVRYIELFSSKGYKIVLSSFCEMEGDNIAINKLCVLLSEKKEITNISVISYNGTNTNELLSAIAESKFMIASRFHATILALVSKIPVLPVIYSDKTANVLNDVGFKGNYIDIRILTSKRVEIASLTDFSVSEIDGIEKIKSYSNNHFKKLDLLLDN